MALDFVQMRCDVASPRKDHSQQGVGREPHDQEQSVTKLNEARAEHSTTGSGTHLVACNGDPWDQRRNAVGIETLASVSIDHEAVAAKHDGRLYAVTTAECLHYLADGRHGRQARGA